MRKGASLGRLMRIGFHVTQEDADRLASIAWEERCSQTTVIERLLRSLPKPTAAYLAAKQRGRKADCD